ncbi:ABC transporter ATP-binding protein [Rothia kristinae]|uniref:ABC transporter ATP-binding protein n=1 Tax=Rothia kristinae TaxID=37923 RepID=UPI00073734AC|nr:ATP-binding cassette domain-containing protein [Rothia kristinae]KTR40038.1 ABC transporter [Rothia kristinae]KTR60541.1 ABC transporter [Rothia kristinae]KTR70121.1 ABC transporter [Rothia kristinae]KTR74131.1 ABC transporter [Rothia kristinae]KTR78770.1 ABC transporter [Rothia kristinae]
MSQAPVLLEVSGARKTYPGARAPVLDGVDLRIRRGESVVFLGPSGSGKSTLLRAIGGLEPLDAGTVRTASRPAVVFQDPALYPWLTVAQNIALAGRFRAHRGQVSRGRVRELLDVLGLTSLADTAPGQLSGGQAQRVAVGRALAAKPQLLLLDEPFSALDPATREDLQHWLRRLIEDLELTAVTVTHDVAEATALGDRVGFFRTGAGFERWWTVPRTDRDPDTDALTADLREHYRGAREEWII